MKTFKKLGAGGNSSRGKASSMGCVRLSPWLVPGPLEGLRGSECWAHSPGTGRRRWRGSPADAGVDVRETGIWKRRQSLRRQSVGQGPLRSSLRALLHPQRYLTVCSNRCTTLQSPGTPQMLLPEKHEHHSGVLLCLFCGPSLFGASSWSLASHVASLKNHLLDCLPRITITVLSTPSSSAWCSWTGPGVSSLSPLGTQGSWQQPPAHGLASNCSTRLPQFPVVVGTAALPQKAHLSWEWLSTTCS